MEKREDRKRQDYAFHGVHFATDGPFYFEESGFGGLRGLGGFREGRSTGAVEVVGLRGDKGEGSC